MIDDGLVEALRRHWDDGWNQGDVATIMAPFTDDVVFSSPFVALVAGGPGEPVAGGAARRTTIQGRDALRAYVERALARTPGIRYAVDGTYAGTDAVVLVYRCFLPDGRIKHGADLMGIAGGVTGGVTGADVSGTVVEWRCHYAAASMAEL